MVLIFIEDRLICKNILIKLEKYLEQKNYLAHVRDLQPRDPQGRARGGQTAGRSGMARTRPRPLSACS